MSENEELLKDQKRVNNKSQYEEVAARLVGELGQFNDEFRRLSNIVPREEEVLRNHCEKIEPNKKGEISYSERRLCKCLYYTNTVDPVSKECDKCVMRDKQSKGYNVKLVGNFKVVTYEFVPTNKGEKVGNVDLILADDNYTYLTEVKPPESKETLLRMFLEIETYYRVAVEGQRFKKYAKEKPLRKAILFFENSEQHKAYLDPNKAQNTKKLLEQFGVTVLCASLSEEGISIKVIG